MFFPSVNGDLPQRCAHIEGLPKPWVLRPGNVPVPRICATGDLGIGGRVWARAPSTQPYPSLTRWNQIIEDARIEEPNSICVFYLRTLLLIQKPNLVFPQSSSINMLLLVWFTNMCAYFFFGLMRVCLAFPCIFCFRMTISVGFVSNIFSPHVANQQVGFIQGRIYLQSSNVNHVWL